MAHTKGPWIWALTGSVMKSHAQPFVVAERGKANLIAGIFGDVKGGEETARANAALITAAPDLLVALKEARDFIKNERDVRFDSYTLGGTSTLDSAGMELVSEADARLIQIDAAVAKAETPT